MVKMGAGDKDCEEELGSEVGMNQKYERKCVNRASRLLWGGGEKERGCWAGEEGTEAME